MTLLCGFLPVYISKFKNHLLIVCEQLVAVVVVVMITHGK